MSSLLILIKLLPDLIAIIKKLIWAIEAGADYIDVRIALDKFHKAEQKAEDKKDTSDLENIFK